MPIDFSRHCDSVETCATPSPSTVSSFGEVSPVKLQRTNSVFNGARSDTPIYNYRSTVIHQYNNSLESQSKNETKSPEKNQQFQTIKPNSDDISEAKQAEQPSIEHLSTSSYSDELERGIRRPFLAYQPGEPYELNSNLFRESITKYISNEQYEAFRQQMLQQLRASGQGKSNPNMRRINQRNDNDLQIEQDTFAMPNSLDLNTSEANGNEIIKDMSYYERRRKNNLAAKRSRDRRRDKEDEIAIRAAYLERENIQLKIELQAVRQQLALYKPNVNGFKKTS